MAEQRLRLLDLFAGCGGLTRGFLDTGGYRLVGAVEKDRDAAASHALSFGAPIHVGDVGDWSRGSLPLAEVIVGGPPCQGFSLLGRRDDRDPRNTLWRSYIDVVARVRPALFVLENVPRFLDGQEFEHLLSEARRGRRLEGWEIEAHVLDAWKYGAAQGRRRAFVIGRPRGMDPLGPPTESSPRLTLSDVLSGVDPEVHRVGLPDSRVVVDGREVAGPFKTRDLHVTGSPSQISLERYRAVPPGGGRRDLPQHLRLPAWKREDYTGAADVMGRLRWDRPSVTLRTEFHRPEKGRFLHPDQDRALTHYEAALLQGFPEEHLWCGSKSSIARQIGNAVPVPLASAIGAHLRTVLW